jgi:hypothetical protein
MNQDAMTVVVALAVLVIVGLLVWLGLGMRRSRSLRERFGPEYQQAVEAAGDRRKAEEELDARRRRVEKLHIKPLPESDAGRYRDSWRTVQARFVEDPEQAVAEADRLVARVMEARGYPVGDFEQRAADVSVDHPHVVTHYRAAHAIAVRNAGGQAGTEDLRQAVIHYRALFEDLLEAREPVGVS